MSTHLSTAPHQSRKKRELTRAVELLKTKFGGGIGIRTLDRLLTYAGFQDRCIQPLCHPTVVVALIIQRRNLRTSNNYAFLSEPPSVFVSAAIAGASAGFLRLRGSFDARATGACSGAATGAAGAGLLGVSVLGRWVLIST